LPQILTRAIRVAIAKRGVAVVVIPGDIALKPLNAKVPHWLLPAKPVIRPADAELGALAKLLNEGARVTLLCGAGCAEAHDEVVALAAKLKAPIVHAYRGKEYLEYDNPYDVGMTGLVGFASGYAAIKECDTLLLLGTDFPYRAFYPEHARILQIDERPEALGNRCSLDLGLLGDIKHTVEALLPKLQQKQDTQFLDAALAHYAKARRDLDALAESGPKSKHIHPQYVSRLASELAAEDAIFTADVGSPIVWAARYLKMNGKRRIIGSFNHGSMANAMLQAIGAQTAFPKRQVVSFSGDGGFTMMMGDFITLKQIGLNVKVIVLNNGTLGFIEMEMKASGFLDTGTELKNPNFAAMAEAMGIKGIRVEKPQDLRSALTDAFAHDGPVLVDVVSARQELAMPPKTTLDQAYHFGMFTMKAILDGRATELIDLAKVNLTR
jgi:pyruvate dehydrogenase (quinone)